MPKNLIWFELPTSDTERTRAFYGSLFGWKYSGFGDMDYHLINDAQPGGAIIPGEGKSPVIYFETDDIDAAVKQVNELSGTAGPIQEIPGIGRSVLCQDDQGMSFGLYQPAGA